MKNECSTNKLKYFFRLTELLWAYT